MKNFIIAAMFVFGVSTAIASETADLINKEAKTIEISHQVQGNIVDKITGEALAGVAVQLEGLNKIYYTDFDGNFVINNVNPGVYDVNVQYLSYQNLKLKEVCTNEKETNLKVELEYIASEF